MATLRFMFRSGGAGCRHVHVLHDDGSPYRVLHEGDIARAEDNSDDRFVAQVKRVIKDAGGLQVGMATIKHALEAKDWTP